MGLLLMFPTFIMGCKSDFETRKVIQMLRSFEESSIDLPDNLLKMEGQNSSFCQIDLSLPTMVYFHGKDECTDCAINHLPDKKPMFQMADSLKTFQVVVLFSPKPEDVPHVIQTLSERETGFPKAPPAAPRAARGTAPRFPVYVDIDGLMPATLIPTDQRFHSFLLYDKHPVMVGNPLSSKALMSVFTKTLLSINNNNH